jgi:hypothetical protein
MKHLRELQVAAVAGDVMAQQALESELFVAHHLRQGDPARNRFARRGYSGCKSRPYENVGFKRGMAITAKTLQSRRSIDHGSISPDYGFDRLQMLKDRKERRDARVA